MVQRDTYCVMVRIISVENFRLCTVMSVNIHVVQEGTVVSGWCLDLLTEAKLFHDCQDVVIWHFNKIEIEIS